MGRAQNNDDQGPLFISYSEFQHSDNRALNKAWSPCKCRVLCYYAGHMAMKLALIMAEYKEETKLQLGTQFCAPGVPCWEMECNPMGTGELQKISQEEGHEQVPVSEEAPGNIGMLN